MKYEIEVWAKGKLIEVEAENVEQAIEQATEYFKETLQLCVCVND